MTKMEKINKLADLCGRAAIESRKLAIAKHEGKSTEELHKIEENLCKLITESKEKTEELNEELHKEHLEKKGA